MELDVWPTGRMRGHVQEQLSSLHTSPVNSSFFLLLRTFCAIIEHTHMEFFQTEKVTCLVLSVIFVFCIQFSSIGFIFLRSMFPSNSIQHHSSISLTIAPFSLFLRLLFSQVNLQLKKFCLFWFQIYHILSLFQSSSYLAETHNDNCELNNYGPSFMSAGLTFVD